MPAYYNEFDPFASAWLRELIKDNLIADGVVDQRNILEVEPNDLKGFTQCHFFAGIGGWSYALRLAGWGDDRPVWTGSPPCQPFSQAGKRKGLSDERHLWPAFFNLIRECKPPTVFGEQVAAAIKDGWFDNLQSDMEGEGYACGMVVLPACSVGAPHKRDRLWFVADSSTVGNTNCNGLSEGCEATTPPRHGDTNDTAGWPDSNPTYCKDGSALGDSKCEGQHEAEIGRSSRPSQTSSWVLQYQGSSTIYGRDGKYRQIPIEPSLFPLANGVPNRVGILRGAGNAIVPQVAAEVIKAYRELKSGN